MDKGKVLIAEDDENSRELLTAALGAAGYAVSSAGNGFQALEMARSAPPDMIISDILMPKMDGYALCRAVRQDPALAHVPLVFYTATYTEPRDQALAFSVGAARFLVKPMAMGELLDILERVLRETGAGDARAAPLGVPHETFEALHGERLQAKLSKKLQELEEKTRQLEASEQRFRDYAESVADWFWETDADLRITMVSGGPPALTATTLKNLLMGATSGELAGSHYIQALRDINNQRTFRDLVVDFTDGAGQAVSLRLSGKPTFDQYGTFRGFRGVGRDVTETVSLNRRIQFLAHHDELTGLPNRALFKDRLSQAIERARHEGQRIVVCCIDLDNFKLINDTLGHDAGDLLLQESVRRIKGSIRDGDVVARLSGDEFMLLMAGVDPVDAHLAAKKILSCFEPPMMLGERKVYASVTMGLSVYPDDALHPQTLLTYAEMAMCRAKEKGRGCFEYYTDGLNAAAHEWLAIETDLRHALDTGGLFLVYQPQVALTTQRLVGVEALLRWRHPERGLVMPGQFIPVAERSGLIIPVSEWVMAAVCRQINAWDAEGVSVPRVSVNISSQHIRGNKICADLHRLLSLHELTGDRLCLEITEHALLENVETARASVEELYRAGAQFSLDDFGLGYSSLAYLKRFPAQEIKIDRSFVDGTGTGEEDLAICRAIISLGHAFGMRVVAEGVETAAQLNALMAEGCDAMQGYLIARPMEDSALREWLAAR